MIQDAEFVSQALTEVFFCF